MKRSLIAAVILLFAAAGCDDPKHIRAEVDTPLMVKKGQGFEIRCKVHNDSKEAQKLVSLDIADEYLAGVAIESMTPAYSESSHVPLDNTVSYVLNTLIPAKGTVEVLIKARAVKPGDFAGDIDFCINTDYSFISRQVRAVIE